MNQVSARHYIVLKKNATVDQLRDEFPQVFSEGIGKITTILGEYRLKENTTPKYIKARK